MSSINRLIQLRKKLTLLRQEEQSLCKEIKSTHPVGEYGAFKIIMRRERNVTIKAHKVLKLT